MCNNAIVQYGCCGVERRGVSMCRSPAGVTTKKKKGRSGFLEKIRSAGEKREFGGGSKAVRRESHDLQDGILQENERGGMI